jgi:peptidoglycan pentaglycine glycine transferase (the first glycine)
VGEEKSRVKSSTIQFDDIALWDKTIGSFPEPHILPTGEWGQVKSKFGWQPLYKIWRDGDQTFAAALILMRTLKLGFLPFQWRVMYVPKGPLLINWSNSAHRDIVFDDLRNLAEENHAIFLKIDPDIITGYGLPGEEGYSETETGKIIIEQMHSLGWLFSEEQVQFRNTVMIDVSEGEETLLKNMKQKARYNLRLAGRKGVTVRLGDEQDFELLYQMYAETASRDGFIIREKKYYQTIWKLFGKSGLAQPILAEFDGEVIAGMILFHLAGKSWFLYGMSRATHRDKMPNYLLQWEAIRYSKSIGCDEYDLWGAPDDNSEDDPLANVYRFKQGLGGKVVRHIGAWDLPIKPTAYYLYTHLLPRILALWRMKSRKQTQKLANQGV